MDAIFNYNGFPIKLETEKYNIRSSYTLSHSGILNSFELNSIRYKLFQLSDFKLPDKEYSTARIGYYDVEYFASYRRGTTTLAILNSYGLFDESNFEIAEEGDIAYLRKLSPKPPFTDYYFRDVYQFKVKYPTNSNYPKNYKKVSEFPPINTDINSPDYSVVDSAIHSTNNSFRKIYYTKNLGDFIGSWQIQDELSDDDLLVDPKKINEPVPNSKKQFARVMTFICWKIYYIEKDILSVLAITDISFIKIFYANKIQLEQNPATTDQIIIGYAEDYDGLPLIDKIIAELLHQWGVIKFENGTLINDFPSTFTSDSTYDEIVDYYSSLNSFHESLRYENELLLFPGVISEEKDSTRRVKYLINLSKNALLALPFANRLEILKGYISKIELTESEQRIVVRLMNAFSNEHDANAILDYFLELGNGNITNFENLYYKLTDARLERYTIINWFVDHQTNRKFFIYIMHDIWQKSKYDFTFVPAGVTPNLEGYNPSGFFLTEGPDGGDKYLAKYDVNDNLISGAPTKLEFKTMPPDGVNSFAHTQLSSNIGYEAGKPLQGKMVTVNKYNETTYIDNLDTHGSGIRKLKTKEKYGEYHLYQPLSLLGYQPNLTLKIPSIGAIPAFLLYYSDEFDDIYDLDAAISFGIDVAVEVGLFFIFGGAGALRHVRHIRQLSKFKHLRLVTSGGTTSLELVGIATNETMIFWSALSGATEVISVTASVFMSFYNYEATIENDEEKQALYKKVSNVFMYMALGTGLTSGFARTKATKLANEIIENTPQQIFEGLPNDVIEVLRTLKRRKVDAILSFSNKLDNLTTTSPNLLRAFFISLDNLPELQALFWKDFGKINDINIWNKLNSTDILNRWQQMADLNIAERVNFNILDDLASTNAIVRYYGEPSLRTILESMSFERRWQFLDHFSTKLDDVNWMNKLIEKPKAINRWANTSGQTKLWAKTEPDLWLYIADDLPTNTRYKAVGGSSVKHEFLDLEEIVHFRGKRTGPPPKFNIEGLMKYKKLSLTQQQVKIDEAIASFRQSTVRYGPPPRTYQGVEIPISHSGIGMGPDFKNLGMAFDPPGSNNLGNGITDIPELTEPLSSIIQKIKDFPEGVKVPIIENTRKIDYKNMWRKMGINPIDGNKIKKELNLDIHHLDDLDVNLYTTLQIVSSRAHNMTKRHSGSVKLNEIFFDLINNL